jgi:hypothetical protein
MTSFVGQGTKSDGLPDSYEIQVNLDAGARVHRAGLVLAMLQGKSHLLHPAVDAAGWADATLASTSMVAHGLAHLIAHLYRERWEGSDVEKSACVFERSLQMLSVGR